MNRTADASALGYGAFALTLWLASMGPAGWFEQPWHNILLILLTAALGGCVLGVAGILQWARGRNLDALLFIAFAAYWWVAALDQHINFASRITAASAGFLGWYYATWALLAFCAWIAACRDGVARMLFTLGLWLTLFSFALANWIHLDALTMLGGYLGLVTAIVAIYICAAEAANGIHGRTVLPLGENGADEAARQP
ncbi:MAG TPA: acetate uptake transporter [Rhodanobacteraceae bacterium]